MTGTDTVIEESEESVTHKWQSMEVKRSTLFLKLRPDITKSLKTVGTGSAINATYAI